MAQKDFFTSGVAIDFGAYAVRFAGGGTALTADRTLTINTVDANRTLSLAGNLTLANNFTTVGAFAMSLTATGATSVTLPTSGTLAVTGSNTFTGNQSINAAGSTSAGSLVFGGATNNWIDFGTTGIAAPAFTTRSLGTKIVLYNNIGGAAVDYGFGIESGALWSSVGSTANSFKWYGGVTLAATLTGAGALTLVGGIAASNLSIASSLTTAGAFALTLTQTGATNVTLPTTGTLATLAGVETLAGKTLTTPLINGGTVSTSATVTAGTNAQGQGPLTSDNNVITTAASAPSGVTLPTATTGRNVQIVNKGANIVNVYPAVGGAIDALGVNVSIALPVNGMLEFRASSTTQWYSSSNLLASASSVSSALTFNNGGAGDASGTTFNGSVARTLSYNSIGAPSTTGTGASGTWGISVSGNAATATSAATLTTPRNINAVSFNGSADIVVPTIYDTAFKSIVNPGGATYTTTTASIPGAIAVSLPVGMTSTMIRMTIKVFEYATNESFTVYCGGYAYSVGPTWISTFAYIIGNPGIDRRHTVRFGYTAGLKAVIYIGELASTWDYPQVFVTDVQLGYGSQSISYTSGWTIGFQASAFENVTATVTNPQVGYAVSTNTANSTVLRDGSGNFSAGTITAALTGTASLATNVVGGVAGAVHYQSGVSTTGFTAAGTSGQALISTGTTAPVWTTLDLTYIPDAWIKRAVTAATTVIQPITGRTATTLTIGGTTLTYDGVVLANGNRVLVKNSTSGTGSGLHDNGIYVVSGIGTAVVLTRAADADTASELGGATVNVDLGTVNGGLIFTNDFKTTSTVGTTAMNWYQLLSLNDAASTNTANKVVLRDASGNFSAGTITAALTGNATTATSAGSVTNALTISAGGAGDGSGATFNGSAARTISYNSIGAAQSSNTFLTGTAHRAMAASDVRNITNPLTGIGYAQGGRFRFSALNDDSTTPYADVIDLSTYNDSSGGGFNSLYLGKHSQIIIHKWAAAGGTSWTSKTIAYTDSTLTGTWTGTVIAGQYGGTGVANTGRTITLAGNLTLAGAFALTLTQTGATNVTLPTTGTLATIAGVETLTSKTLTTPQINAATVGVSATVTAGTNAQGQGPLTSDFNVVTTNASSPGGVTLPTATAGRTVSISNRTVNALNVYPAVGASIDGGATNAPVPLAAGGALSFTAGTTTTWYSAGSSSSSSGGGNFTFDSTPPGSPADGDQWLNDSDGILYTYFDDGTSSQWVELGKSPVFSVPTTPVFIQETEPSITSAYLWIQTGLGDEGEDFTFWINTP